MLNERGDAPWSVEIWSLALIPSSSTLQFKPSQNDKLYSHLFYEVLFLRKYCPEKFSTLEISQCLTFLPFCKTLDYRLILRHLVPRLYDILGETQSWTVPSAVSETSPQWALPLAFSAPSSCALVHARRGTTRHLSSKNLWIPPLSNVLMPWQQSTMPSKYFISFPPQTNAPWTCF